jgi:hypothetical protein
MFSCFRRHKIAVFNDAWFRLESAIQDDDHVEMINIIQFSDNISIHTYHKSNILNPPYKLSPIHMACRFNSPKCLQSLIHEPGIDINAPDAQGWTPIHYSAVYHPRYRNSCLLLLIHAHANTTTLTKGGGTVIHHGIHISLKHNTPFQLAKLFACYESCKLLQQHTLLYTPPSRTLYTTRPCPIPTAPIAVPC